ncbi:hypothetical protein ACP4OV_010998 [Aristida adscensionis]
MGRTRCSTDCSRERRGASAGMGGRGGSGKRKMGKGEIIGSWGLRRRRTRMPKRSGTLLIADDAGAAGQPGPEDADGDGRQGTVPENVDTSSSIVQPTATTGATGGNASAAPTPSPVLEDDGDGAGQKLAEDADGQGRQGPVPEIIDLTGDGGGGVQPEATARTPGVNANASAAPNPVLATVRAAQWSSSSRRRQRAAVGKVTTAPYWRPSTSSAAFGSPRQRRELRWSLPVQPQIPRSPFPSVKRVRRPYVVDVEPLQQPAQQVYAHPKAGAWRMKPRRGVAPRSDPPATCILTDGQGGAGQRTAEGGGGEGHDGLIGRVGVAQQPTAATGAPNPMLPAHPRLLVAALDRLPPHVAGQYSLFIQLGIANLIGEPQAAAAGPRCPMCHGC